MKTLILAAGYGTRLQALVKDTPKPLLPVKNKPLIDYSLDKIRKISGLTEVLVVTNNKFAQVFEAWAGGHKDFPVPIKVLNDGTNAPEERLGSIGDIHFAVQKEKINEDVLVIGGDNLFDFGIDDFIRQARIAARPRAQKAVPQATIGLYDVGSKEEAKKYGVVTLDNTGKIVSFVEKPPAPESTLIAMCLYYFPNFSLKLLGRYIEETKRSDTAGEYIQWLAQKETVYGFKFQGKWYDIGSLATYKAAEKDF